jgi:hypothetical protein
MQQLQHPRTDDQAREQKIQWLEQLQQRVADLEARVTALESSTPNVQ